jgi:uncharacterized iron-regulated protein
MRNTFTLFCFIFCSFLFAQNKMPYQIFDKKGKITSYNILLNTSAQAEIVLFGEYHDNSIIHWLEFELAKDLQQKTNLILGAEMLEADNQTQLNQYLKGEIDQKQLHSTARLWPNYKTDYQPLVDFAKEKNIPFIATNIPRKYASMVYKKGFESLEILGEPEKSFIAPLPILYDSNLPGYKKMVEEMGGHGGENLPKAQAIKDATMAYFILKNLQEKSLFIHYNGTYHSDNYDGIYWYLKKSNPKAKIITIATVTQKDISKLETNTSNKADFIIVVDEDVTKTH